VGLEQERNDISVHNRGALWRPSEVGWPRALLSKRPDQRDEFFRAFRVILGVPLQVIESDGRLENHAGRKSHLIRSGFRFVGPLRNSALAIRKITYNELEDIMASIVVCAEPGCWRQAGRFAEKALGDAELKSFEALRRRAPVQPILVFLTNTDYHRLRSLLRTLKPASPDVVIYYANRLAPEEAAQLGKLVGETRPNHTSVVFEAKAAAASVLGHSRSSGPGNGRAPSPNGPQANRTRRLREHFRLTQTELANTLGISLRTVQNWERASVAARPRQLRDLEELWSILKESIKGPDIPAWLRSESDAFAGQRPIELLKEGKARDIIVEFRRLQAGEPV
jgi:DNA-binding XRE family transcriptional regulator